MDCENCGEPATRRVVEGWDPRTRQTTDVDVDYGYYCDDCAGDEGEPFEVEPDEDRDNCRSINELHTEAWEMDRNPSDPRW